MSNKKKNNFVIGAAILSGAGILSRVMGLGYRVVLIRLIGAEGMGIYQMAYPLYTIMLVVSRSGIPVALAKMVAGRLARNKNKDAYRIFTIARILSVVIGLLSSITMALLAGPLISILKLDPRSYYAILAISPAVFIVSVMASYRGFFQGMQDMKPTALSQLLEQFVRTITMIILAYLLLPIGLNYAAAGASFGAVTGAIAGLLSLIYIYYKSRKSIFDFINEGNELSEYQIQPIVKELTKLAIPITIGALVQPLMSLVDWIFVPQRLQAAGFMMGKVTTLYGRLTTVAMPLVQFPTIITVSLATSLVPAISEAYELENQNLIYHRTTKALRMTYMLGLPAAIGLFVLSRQLTEIIYNEPQAASILAVVSWGVLFITLQQTSSAILQGIGRTDLPAKNLFIGAAFNAIINYTLTGISAINIHGAAFGTVIGFAVAALLNLKSVYDELGFLVGNSKRFIYPSIVAILMGFITYFSKEFIFKNFVIQGFLLELAVLILLVGIGVGSYFVLLIYSGEIGYEELKFIPKIGEKLAEKLKEWGVIDY
ncbi:MAG: putative polysaccharide biosynthesis protein [Bacillota bacterium]